MSGRDDNDIRIPQWAIGAIASIITGMVSVVGFRATVNAELAHVQKDIQKLQEDRDAMRNSLGKLQFNMWSVCKASNADCPYNPGGKEQGQ